LNKGVLLKIFIGRGGLRAPPQPKPSQKVKIGEDFSLYNLKLKEYIGMRGVADSDGSLVPVFPTDVRRLLMNGKLNRSRVRIRHHQMRFRIINAGIGKIGLWSVAQRCFIRVDMNDRISGFNGVKGKLNEDGIFEWNPNERLSADEIFTIIPSEYIRVSNSLFSPTTTTIPCVAFYNEYYQKFISCTSYSSSESLSLKAQPGHPRNIKGIIDSVHFEIRSLPVQYTAIHGRCGGDTIITDISQSILLRAQGGNGGCGSYRKNRKIKYGVGGGMKSSYNKKYVTDVIIYPGGKGGC